MHTTVNVCFLSELVSKPKLPLFTFLYFDSNHNTHFAYLIMNVVFFIAPSIVLFSDFNILHIYS